MRPMYARFAPAITLAATMLLTGCHDSSTGNAQLAPPATRFADVEPNDDFNAAHDLGTITPGFAFTGSGTVSFNDDASNDDEFDSFMVIANGRQLVTVVLEHDSAADLDLAFVDPTTGTILNNECDEPQSPEICAFELEDGQRINIEVEAFDGDGSYTLDIASTGL